jgi:hypothetical protein
MVFAGVAAAAGVAGTAGSPTGLSYPTVLVSGLSPPARSSTIDMTPLTRLADELVVRAERVGRTSAVSKHVTPRSNAVVTAIVRGAWAWRAYVCAGGFPTGAATLPAARAIHPVNARAGAPRMFPHKSLSQGRRGVPDGFLVESDAARPSPFFRMMVFPFRAAARPSYPGIWTLAAHCQWIQVLRQSVTGRRIVAFIASCNESMRTAAVS